MGSQITFTVECFFTLGASFSIPDISTFLHNLIAEEQRRQRRWWTTRCCCGHRLLLLTIQLAKGRPTGLFLDNGDQSSRRSSRGWRWWRRWWWLKHWKGQLGFLLSLSPGFTSRCISCLSARSTSTPAVLLAKLLVNTSSCLLLCLWSSRAKVSRGAKLDFQHSAELAIHSLQGESHKRKIKLFLLIF